MQAFYMDEHRSIADLSDIGAGRWEINRINVLPQHRGQGYGRALLKRVLEDADAEGIILELSVHATGREDVDPDFLALSAWYQRNGFDWEEPDRENSYRMERFPG